MIEQIAGMAAISDEAARHIGEEMVSLVKQGLAKDIARAIAEQFFSTALVTREGNYGCTTYALRLVVMTPEDYARINGRTDES